MKFTRSLSGSPAQRSARGGCVCDIHWICDKVKHLQPCSSAQQFAAYMIRIHQDSRV